jgi:hypothetical protein
MCTHPFRQYWLLPNRLHQQLSKCRPNRYHIKSEETSLGRAERNALKSPDGLKQESWSIRLTMGSTGELNKTCPHSDRVHVITSCMDEASSYYIMYKSKDLREQHGRADKNHITRFLRLVLREQAQGIARKTDPRRRSI